MESEVLNVFVQSLFEMMSDAYLFNVLHGTASEEMICTEPSNVLLRFFEVMNL